MIEKLLSSVKLQFTNSWWVLFFALLCFLWYEHEVKIWNGEYRILSKQSKKLQQEKLAAMQLQSELSAQIQSQDTAEWIELLLMRELGVIPEEQTKIYFIK